MTKVFFDKAAGLCPGVKRTIMDALSISMKERNVVSYGELIHNPFVVSQLTKKGITVAHNLSDIRSDQFVIVRAHGIPPEEEEYFINKGIRYINLTCTRVKTVHKIIIDYRDKGYTIIIVGQPHHPETIGHLGYARDKGIILSSLKDAEDIKVEGKCLLIAQTTISAEIFLAINNYLTTIYPSIESINTICSFTILRQKWIDTFSKKTGFSVIIGGKKSSNTGKLYEIALKNGKALWIEDPNDLCSLDFEAIDSIAITGGTSTPEEVLEQAAIILERNGASIVYS